MNLSAPSTKPPKAAKIKTWLNWATGIGLTQLDALILLESAARKKRAWLLSYPEAILRAQDEATFQRLVKKRVQGTPVAYLTGVKEFYGLSLKVNKDVLIPRPETEATVGAALKLGLPKAKLIDVGTGSGAIAIAIAKHRPKWQVTATDISPAALRLARQNANKHKVQIKFIKADLLCNPSMRNKKFHLITANLPYVKDDYELSAEGKQEPAISLRGGTDGLGIYRRFFEQLPLYLAPRGYVIIEADPWQHPSLKELALKSGLGVLLEDKFMLAFRQIS